MLQTGIKERQESAWLDRKGDPLGIVQTIEIWPCWQMIGMPKPEPVLEKETHKILWRYK